MQISCIKMCGFNMRKFDKYLRHWKFLKDKFKDKPKICFLQMNAKLFHYLLEPILVKKKKKVKMFALLLFWFIQ